MAAAARLDLLHAPDEAAFLHRLVRVEGRVAGAKADAVAVAAAGEGGDGGVAEERIWPVAAGGRFVALVPLQLGRNVVRFVAWQQRAASDERVAVAWATRTWRRERPPPSQTRFVRLVYAVCADEDGSFQAPEDEPCDVSRCAADAAWLPRRSA